jgi:FHS family L-fucose permease-like MFS transporter
VVASNGLSAVKIPALILFGLFILCATILWFSKLPTVNSSEKLDKDLGALKYPQLTLGMVAIFVYVGVEVTIQSNLGALLQMPEIKGIDHTKISHFISLYWGSLMIGRWTGALTVFNFSKTTKLMMQIITPFLAFAVIYGINYLRGSQVDDYLYYIPYICIASVLFIFSGDNPARTLLVLSLTACLMMIIGLVSTGNLALYSFISGGLFCSVMWPCIFALAINGLGKYTNQGSSLLVMMILGGAIIPPLQGILVDLLNPQISYIVTVFCFAYLAWYAFKVKSIFKKQGIEFQSHTTVNH